MNRDVCNRCGKVTRPDDVHTCVPKALQLVATAHLGYRAGWQREAAAELRRLHVVNQELLEALKDASLYIQDNYLPDKSGHEWDDVIAKAEAAWAKDRELVRANAAEESARIAKAAEEGKCWACGALKQPERGVDPIAVLFGLANNMANNAEILIQALQPYHPLQVVHKDIVQQVTWMQESVDRYHAFAQQWHDAHGSKLEKEE